MTRMEELESCLSGLLSTLKKNREHVPLEVLKTQYKQPYEELVRNINLTASAYAKSVLLHRLVHESGCRCGGTMYRHQPDDTNFRDAEENQLLHVQNL